MHKQHQPIQKSLNYVMVYVMIRNKIKEKECFVEAELLRSREYIPIGRSICRYLICSSYLQSKETILLQNFKIKKLKTHENYSYIMFKQP